MRLRAPAHPTWRDTHRVGGAYEFQPPLFMPRHTQRCTACDWTGDVIVQPFENPPCASCGGPTERYYPIGNKSHGVVGDDFVGGKWFENLSTQPVWIESKSHLKREMAARNLQHKVRHTGMPGSDKSPNTTRWY